MTAKVPIKFNIYQGETLLRTEVLEESIIKVGKLPSSHLRIEDDNVSRMHAVIEVTGPDEIYIIDLGSASGTIVNGKKVNKCKLTAGDEIMLGGTRVVVELGAAQPQVPSDVPTMAAAAGPAPQIPQPPPPASSGRPMPPSAPVAPPVSAPPAVS